MNRSQKLVSLSLICLGLALVLPSVRVQILRSPVELSGWQATWLAVGLGGPSLHEIFVQPTIATLRMVALALAAATNMTLILTAFLLIRKNTSSRIAQRLTVLVAVGFLLSATAPWMMTNPPTQVLAGYYVWLAAHVLALSALAWSWHPREPRGVSGAIDARS